MVETQRYVVFGYASPEDKGTGTECPYTAQIVYLGPDDTRGILVNSMSHEWTRYVNKLTVPHLSEPVDCLITPQLIDEVSRARDIALARYYRRFNL